MIKTILSDAKSHEEHDETKYSPIGQTTAELWMILCMDVGGKGVKIEMNRSILDNREEGNFPCTFR